MANVVKLSGNFLIATVIESLGEAIALTRKYGVDPHAYVDFLTNTLFSAPVYKTYGGLIADEKYTQSGIQAATGAEGRPAGAARGRGGRRVPALASLIRDHMLMAIARGMEGQDWSSTAKLAAENAGISNLCYNTFATFSRPPASNVSE